jgi:hypothetical protein
MLAIHIDTRSIELISGLLAIITGVLLTFPPTMNILPSFPTTLWAWFYIIFGSLVTFFSVYGPIIPRRYLGLLGVYCWSFITLWLFISSGRMYYTDFMWIACIPYSFFIVSSAFTYISLWRIPSKWNYYESDRVY